VDVSRKSISIQPPFSAGVLYQFLTSQQADHGVKIEGAFKTPVLKIREKGPKPLNEKAGEAWSYYLRYLHQRLVGHEGADLALEDINSLLKKNNVRLTVGMLLDPIQKLAKAEQARIAKSGAIARRWIAQEVNVARIAAGQGGGDDRTNTETNFIIGSLEAAWSLLAKFPDFVDGEINPQHISDEAFTLGHSLAIEDLGRINKVTPILLAKRNELNKYIGPEAYLLLELCAHAKGKNKDEFRADSHTKSLVGKIVAVLCARTDNEEYLVPPSPRTVVKHENIRPTIPDFRYPRNEAGEERTPHSASSGEASAMPLPVMSHGAAARPVGTPEKVRETQDKPRRELRKVSTISGGQAPGTGVNRRAMQGPSAPDENTVDIFATPDRKERKEGRESMQMVSPVGSAKKGERTGKANDKDGTDKVGESRAEKKAAEQRPRDDEDIAGMASAVRRNGKTGQLTGSKGKAPGSRKQPRTSMPSLQEGRKIFDAPEFQKTRKELESLPSYLAGGKLLSRTDSEVFSNWLVLEQRLGVRGQKLGPVLTQEGMGAMHKLASYCHKVDLTQLAGASSLQEAVNAAQLPDQEMAALIGVRDVLLADSRRGLESEALKSFPAALSLLVFAIDADRIRRKKLGLAVPY